MWSTIHPHSEVNNKDTNDPGKNKAKTIAYRYVYIIFRFSNEDEKGKETQWFRYDIEYRNVFHILHALKKPHREHNIAYDHTKI